MASKGGSLGKNGSMKAAATTPERRILTAEGLRPVPGKVFASAGDYFAYVPKGGGAAVTHAPSGRSISPTGLFGFSKAGASQLVRTLNHPDVRAAVEKARGGDRKAADAVRRLIEGHTAHQRETASLAAFRKTYG